jgi:hypothetical protein
LIPYQFSSDVFRTVIPYVVLLALIAILLFVARRVAPLTGKLIEILRTRLNLSEGVADSLSALVRFAIWFVAAVLVVTATLVTFGLGQAPVPGDTQRQLISSKKSNPKPCRDPIPQSVGQGSGNRGL